MMIEELIRLVVDQANRKEKVGHRSRGRNKNLIQEGRSETISDTSRTAERPPTIRDDETDITTILLLPIAEINHQIYFQLTIHWVLRRSKLKLKSLVI